MNKGVYGLKIGMWNIDGLKPKHIDKAQDEDFCEFINRHDIIGLCETHLSPEKAFDYDNYQVRSIYRPRPKNALRDYGGISIIYKNCFKGKITVLQRKETNYVWIQVKQDSLKREKDLFICFAHIPHTESSYFTKINYNILNCIHGNIMEYKNIGDVILLGDFNGRTGTMEDWVTDDTISHLPIEDNYITDKAIRHRKSHDSTVNERGRDIIDLCLSSQVRILNGRVVGDLQGKLTFYKNGVSAIDLCMVDENMFNDVCYFQVNDLNRHLSDHCGISVKIKAKILVECEAEKTDNTLPLPTKYNWNEESSNLFRNALTSPQIQTEIQSFMNNLSETINVEHSVDHFTEILQKVANMCLKKKKGKTSKLSKGKKWYDSELHDLRKEVRKQSRIISNKVANRHDLEVLKHKSKLYRNAC
jgi:hypothetical protein